MVTQKSPGQSSSYAFTITSVVQVEKFSSASPTVRVTEYVPMSEQVNVVWLIDRLVIPQLSKEPLSRSAGVMDTIPVSSGKSVILG